MTTLISRRNTPSSRRRGILAGGVPSFRPAFPEWPDHLRDHRRIGTKIMLGEETRNPGQKIGEAMEAVLQKAGYYDGKKEKLQ